MAEAAADASGRGMTTHDHQKQSKEILGMKAINELPDLVAALDAIDLQLAAGGDGVVLPRDAAALVACALHDLLGQPREGGRR